jgi:hypothetical protein
VTSPLVLDSDVAKSAGKKASIFLMLLRRECKILSPIAVLVAAGADNLLKKVVPIALVVVFLFALPHVAASPSAVIQNESTHIDEAGYYHVVGEAKNTGTVWLQYVRIAATFKDQSGAVVDTSFTYTLLDRVPPGVASGFDVIELDIGKSGMIRSYTLAIEFQEAQPLTTALQIVNTSSSKDALGWLEIVGEVKNGGDTISEYTKVVATFYGADSKVVDVSFTFTDPTTVQPHSQQSFKLVLLSVARSNQAKSWALDTQSNQYASIPETVWPALMLVAALAVGGIAVRKGQRGLMMRYS